MDSQMNDGDIAIKIIDFSSAQYAEVLHLRNEVLRFPLGRSLDKVDLEGESQQLHFVAMTQQGQIAGCLIARKIQGETYKLRQMVVRDNFRGRGIGAKILEEAERHLKNLGAQEFELHARIGALGFYEKCAYVREGEIFKELGIEHVKMCKKLIANGGVS